MECRILDITLISAKGLKKPSLIGKMDVYAVAYITGVGESQKPKTSVHKDGGPDPSWNFPMQFTIDEVAGLQNRTTLVVEIKLEGKFEGKEVGQVHVPIKNLLEGVSREGQSERFVSYQVWKPSGKPNGTLKLSYKLGEKFVQAVPAGDPAGMAVASSFGYQQSYVAVSARGFYPPPHGYPPQPWGYYPPPRRYPPQPQAGYGYQQQQLPGYCYSPGPPPSGYGYPPVQQPQQPTQMNGYGMGLGAGLIGGVIDWLSIASIVSDVASSCNGGGGGGCGGGGCGGGGG